MKETSHITVFKNEAIELLNVVPDRWYVDATAGGGGHTRSIRALGGNVIALDQDSDAILRLQTTFKDDEDVRIHHTNFEHLESVIEQEQVQVFGVLFDLGLSSDQLDDAERGFSLRTEGGLDMRMDTRKGVKALDVLHGLTEKELTKLFAVYGEVYLPRRIAHAVIVAREQGGITTTKELREVVERAYGGRWTRTVHPATQVFQALRIAVNDELEVLKSGLEQAINVLGWGGRIVVISFHSLEDRIVKECFNTTKDLQVLTKKALIPTDEEVELNPRARSAKLRAAVKSENKNV